MDEIERAVKSEHEYMVKRCTDEGNAAYKRGVEVEQERAAARIERLIVGFRDLPGVMSFVDMHCEEHWLELLATHSRKNES